MSGLVQPPSLSRRGFTLVEVMLAMAVLTMLLMILTQVLNQTIRSWRKGEAHHEHRRVERTLTDFLSLELRGVLLPVDHATTLGRAAVKGNLQFLINPPATQVPNQYRYADAIFWQAPLATETTFGEIAVLGYFVKWRTTDQGEQPVLCRLFINPSTASAGMVTQNPAFLVYDANPAKWLSKDILDSQAPATVDNGLIGQFAENVLGLWVQCYDPNGNELGTRAFDSRKGYTYEDSKGIFVKSALPAKVTLSIAQMDGRRAELVSTHASTLKSLAQDPQIGSAIEFQEKLRAEAANTPALNGLVIGLQVYKTDVHLTTF